MLGPQTYSLRETSNKHACISCARCTYWWCSCRIYMLPLSIGQIDGPTFSVSILPLPLTTMSIAPPLLLRCTGARSLLLVMLTPAGLLAPCRSAPNLLHALHHHVQTSDQSYHQYCEGVIYTYIIR